MSLENIELNKDNLAVDSFKTMLANISEKYNTTLQNSDLKLEDINTILSQTMEAYSFYTQIATSSLTQDLSLAKTQLDEIHNTLQTTINNYDTSFNNKLAEYDIAFNSKISNLNSNSTLKQFRNLPQIVSYSGVDFGDFTKWLSAGDTLEEIGTIRSGIVWTDRSEFDKEWLTAMGLSGIRYFAPSSFKVYRLTASKDRTGYSFRYFQFPISHNSYVTYGAFVKHIQGAVPYGWWCQGLKEKSSVALCGGHSMSSNIHYSYCHPYKTVGDEDTIIEVALAGVVDTYISLDNPQNWWNVNNIFRN